MFLLLQIGFEVLTMDGLIYSLSMWGSLKIQNKLLIIWRKMRGCCRKSIKKLLWVAIVVYNVSFNFPKNDIWSMQVYHESCSNYSCQKLYDVKFLVNINPSHLKHHIKHAAPWLEWIEWMGEPLLVQKDPQFINDSENL
jgi:hypothetical protein